MVRHTGEVDVYHLGKWAGLGTRHGVQHFADSAKQQRIANTTYRRFYYFLTADERVGDLMHANVDSTRPSSSSTRSARSAPTPTPRPARPVHRFRHRLERPGVGLAHRVGAQGPQMGEGQGPRAVHHEGIAAQPNGFVQGSGLQYDLDTGTFAVADKPAVSVSTSRPSSA